MVPRDVRACVCVTVCVRVEFDFMVCPAWIIAVNSGTIPGKTNANVASQSSLSPLAEPTQQRKSHKTFLGLGPVQHFLSLPTLSSPCLSKWAQPRLTPAWCCRVLSAETTIQTETLTNTQTWCYGDTQKKNGAYGGEKKKKSVPFQARGIPVLCTQMCTVHFRLNVIRLSISCLGSFTPYQTAFPGKWDGEEGRRESECDVQAEKRARKRFLGSIPRNGRLSPSTMAKRLTINFVDTYLFKLKTAPRSFLFKELLE